MREIKFRVWDKINGEMLVYGKKQIGWMCPIDRPAFPAEAYVFALRGNPEGYSELQWCLDHPEAFTVEQFTGLLDKNGREIYEGDVVSLTNPTCQIQKARLIGVVGYSWASFIVEIKRTIEWKSYNVEPSAFMLLESIAGSKEMAVIGNIHENPDRPKEG